MGVRSWIVPVTFIFTINAAHSTDMLKQCMPQKLDSAEKIDLSQLPGRMIYVDFWASWCEPCKQSFPFMNNLKQQFEGKGVSIIAITVDRDLIDAKNFLKEHSASFLIAHDTDGKCAQEMAVKGMPSSYIMNKKGEILYSHKGFRPSDSEKITKQLQQLLMKK